MYRAIAIAGSAFALAACSSINLDFLKPVPAMDTVRFESEPPGAEARVSNGQTCRTPCALALPSGTGYTVTFALNGFLPASETLEAVSIGDGTVQLRPNPVAVELSPAPPPLPPKPAKPVRKPPAKKPTAAKPAPKPAGAPPAPAPSAAAPPPAGSPWPPAQAR